MTLPQLHQPASQLSATMQPRYPSSVTGGPAGEPPPPPAPYRLPTVSKPPSRNEITTDHVTGSIMMSPRTKGAKPREVGTLTCFHCKKKNASTRHRCCQCKGFLAFGIGLENLGEVWTAIIFEGDDMIEKVQAKIQDAEDAIDAVKYVAILARNVENTKTFVYLKTPSKVVASSMEWDRREGDNKQRAKIHRDTKSCPIKWRELIQPWMPRNLISEEKEGVHSLAAELEI